MRIELRKKGRQDHSGLREEKHFYENGYDLQAISTNGRDQVTAYTGQYQGRRVYGYYDYKTARYIEELIC